MPQLPWDRVHDILANLVIPAFFASFVVMAAMQLAGRGRDAPLAAALAVAVGVVNGNHLSPAIEWRIPPEFAWTWPSCRAALGWPAAAVPGDAGEPLYLPPARFWLPWLAGLAMAVELLAKLPGLRGVLGWLPRLLLALLAGQVLTPPGWHIDMPAVPWLLGGAIILNWFVLAMLARQWQDGTLPTALAVCCAAAAVVLVLQADSKRYMDMSLFLFAVLVGIALVVWVWPGNTSTAAAAVATFLPGLLLIGYHGLSREVMPSPRNFLLTALAPLTLTPMLWPSLTRQEGWKRWVPGIGLPCIPAIWAIVAVLQTESTDVE